MMKTYIALLATSAEAQIAIFAKIALLVGSRLWAVVVRNQ
jgi:hypothetical protein